MKAYRIAGFILAVLLPLYASADIESFKGFVEDTLLDIANAVIVVLFAIATLVFIYGIIRYIGAGGDAEAIKKARSFIIWSVVGLVLILGVWGVATFVAESLFGDIQAQPTTPPLERPEAPSS